MNHRDHINAFNAKRVLPDLDEDREARIAELLAAAQQKDREKPVYREWVKPVEIQGEIR